MYQDINCSEFLTIMVYNTNIIGPLELHDHSFIDWSCILHLCTVAQTTVSPEYLYGLFWSSYLSRFIIKLNKYRVSNINCTK